MTEFNLKVSFLDEKIQCSIELGERVVNEEFAFYIFCNGERIHVRWYSSDSKLVFDTKGKPGSYQVTGFVKSDGGEPKILRSKSFFSKPIDLYETDFNIIDNTMNNYKLVCNNWKFPALYYPCNGNYLFVLLPSAISRGEIALPVFNRWNWAEKGFFPGNTLCISDPTLEMEDKLGLPWLLGDRLNFATDELAEFISKFAASKKIPNTRVVFYGSSAGGFSALALSARVEGSIAIAINAQTDIMSYSVKNQVALIRKTCFDNLSEEEIRDKYPSRVQMISLWENVKESRVILLQNITDNHHYNTHFKPFWASLGGLDFNEGLHKSGKHTAWIYNQEGGHIPETLEMAKKAIDMAII